MHLRTPPPSARELRERRNATRAELSTLEREIDAAALRGADTKPLEKRAKIARDQVVRIDAALREASRREEQAAAEAVEEVGAE